eukprot:scaffold508685_cov38-Prasinocladus_malaysianus.AAC.1
MAGMSPTIARRDLRHRLCSYVHSSVTIKRRHDTKQRFTSLLTLPDTRATANPSVMHCRHVFHAHSLISLDTIMKSSK